VYQGYRTDRETSVESIEAVCWSEILGEVADPVAVVSREYEVVWANRTLLGFLGLGLEQLGSRPCYELIQKRVKRCPDCPVSIVFSSGEPQVMEKCFRCERESVVWREIRAYPIRSADGRVIGAIRIGFDITKRKLLEDHRTRHVEALERTLSGITEASAVRGPQSGASESLGDLSNREIQVLRLLAKGLSNSEIAGILNISPHTVKSHVVHIFRKLGVSSRTDAAVTALNLKLI